jgi:hypothetical protein
MSSRHKKKKKKKIREKILATVAQELNEKLKKNATVTQK